MEVAVTFEKEMVEGLRGTNDRGSSLGFGGYCLDRVSLKAPLAGVDSGMTSLGLSTMIGAHFPLGSNNVEA